MVEKRTRDKRIYFHVTQEEANRIDSHMSELGIINREAYLRKMAMNGYIIKVELTSINEMIRLLRSATNNMNQIAKRANETRSIYKDDVEDLQGRYDELWAEARKILTELSMITPHH